MALQLPRGSARPPLLEIGLWDDELKNEDDALAVAEVRLSQDGGAHSIELIGRKGSGCKRVRVSFVVSMVEDAVS